MASTEVAVGPKLETDRKSLLDLTLRNPLLNYRPRSRGLEAVGELPVEVYRLLVREGRTLSFLHDPEAVVEGSEDREESPSPEPDGASSPFPQPRRSPQANPMDQKLQTALAAEALEKRLLAIYYAARTSLEERGVNTLFLALGLLTWYESDASETPLRAPLILVPVELERSSARERFRLRQEGEDVGFNLSLAEKLRAEFRVTLPELPDADELDVAAYFDAVAVAGRPRWSVDRAAVVLGFFSFGKFLMYVDLEEARWPEGDRPGDHRLLRALLSEGFRDEAAGVGDDEPLDGHIDPKTSRQILDADSSQTLALLDVSVGRNLVIQGPPGTGKSQTIANLIAEAVARGQTVLFVAEKMAALEVVKRRLDAAAVGNACLELHSHKTQKKAVLAELRRTLELGRPRLGAFEDDLSLLVASRDRLNAYCDAVNVPVGPSGETPHQAFGALLRLRGDDGGGAIPRPDLPAMLTWSGVDFQQRLGLVEPLQARLAAIGPPRAHPFWGSRQTVVMPSDADRFRAQVPGAVTATTALREAVARLAGAFELDPPETPQACEPLVNAVTWVEWRATCPGLAVDRAEWSARRAERAEILAAVDAFVALRGDPAHAEVWPLAWEFGHDPASLRALRASLRRSVALLPETRAYGCEPAGLRALRADVAERGHPWWRYASPAYWRSRCALGAYFASARPPRGLDEQLAVLDALLDAQRHLATLERHRELAARLLGGSGLFGGDPDWTRIKRAADFLRALESEIDAGRVPEGIFLRLCAPEGSDDLALQPLAQALVAARAAHRGAWDRIAEPLQLDAAARFGPEGLDGVTFSDQQALLDLWSQRINDLNGLAAWNAAAQRARAAGLAGVVDLAENWAEAPRELVRAFRARWFEGLIEQAFRDRPALAAFDATGHEHDVDAFVDLDRKALRHARGLIAETHWRGMPRQGGIGQLGTLLREFEKKTRHLPVRQLMARAGRAVQAIKPVFMMSPMSVAAYLPPDSLRFDLVVFDEASQVRPVDAFGALLRGKQAVVVGDSRQLPPTSFFDRLIGDDDRDDGEELSSDVESILGLFAAQGAPQRMLRWHYRSRHESLIAVSNHEFYDDRLVVFPSPDAHRGEAGLVFRHLPGTVYDRGHSRTNPGEAEAVAKAVMDFARAQLARPEGQRLTLGVAAFSMAQREALVDGLEKLRRDDPVCEPFFAEGTAEPFFVKNLENVQGDERDVIYISVGYGRDAEGRVAMNFGPLNADGGERRLNVLITRARLRCEVFTNLNADDLDLARSPARGVRALKTFLAYARDGQVDSTRPGAKPATPRETTPPLPFVELVASALRQSGHEVQARVGSAGFVLDLGVVDPDRPGRFLLGITCDGPSYQSARSARDRDRLRRQVLEQLGWRLHRIWSPAWFRDPEAELDRALDAIEEARAAATTVVTPESRGTGTPAPDPGLEDPPQDTPADPTAVDLPAELERSDDLPVTDDSSIHESPAVPYQLAALRINLRGRDLHEVPASRLARWVVEVVKAEGPVHRSEVARRVVDAAGVKRIGNRIQGALDLAVEAAVRGGSVRREGEFLWPTGMLDPPVRDRGGLPTASRRLELVAPEELAAAVEQVIADAFGLEPTAIPAAACRRLGFARASDDIRRRFDAIVESLIARKRLELRGNHVIPGESPVSKPTDENPIHSGVA